MPVKDRYPEWEREDNRTKIFSTIFKESMTFTELRNHTGFAKSTLSSHLKELKEYGVIEKALENDRVVYRTSLNEEALEAEFKRKNFDSILHYLLQSSPEIGVWFKVSMKLAVRTIIFNKKRELDGKPPLPDDEVYENVWQIVKKEIPENEQRIFQSIIAESRARGEIEKRRAEDALVGERKEVEK